MFAYVYIFNVFIFPFLKLVKVACRHLKFNKKHPAMRYYQAFFFFSD